jgi:hypothetical protein
MLAGFDQGRRGFPGAGVQASIMGQKPGKPSSPGAGGRLAVEKRREKTQGVNEFAHRRGGGGIGGRRQKQFQPSHTALGEPGPCNPQTGAPPRFPVGQGVCQIPVAFHGRLVRRHGRACVGEHGSKQVGEQQRKRLRQESLALFRVGTCQLFPRQRTTNASGVR